MIDKKRLIASGVAGVVFDSDYQAILNRATALGYTKPSAAQQVKQNAFLVALKAAGIWALLDTLKVFANDGGSAFATIDWRWPLLYQATLVNTPTFTANQGFAGNGATSYVNSGFNPSTGSIQASQNSYAFAIGVNSNPAQSDTDIGFSDNGASYSEFVVRSAFFPGESILRMNCAAANFIRAVNATKIGNYVGRRDGVNTYNICKNGVQYGAQAAAPSIAVANLNVYLGGRNASGVLTAPTTEQFTHYARGNFGALQATWNTLWSAYFASL